MSFYENAKKLSPIVKFIFNLRVEGAENLPSQGAVVLCCNHLANIDPVLLGSVIGRSLNFMAKAELFKVPLLKGLIKALGAFPVNRGAGDNAAINTAIAILERGDVLAMFPEGHRNKVGGEPKQFKKGAALVSFRTGAVVVPAAIVCKGKVRVFNRKLIRVGRPMTHEELGFTDGSPENLREVSAKIRRAVAELIQAKG